jgi:N-formylmaleamate deformylase
MENHWESAFVEANGMRLHYLRTNGTGPAVVLAHGFSDNGRCWRRLVGALESDFDLIMFDARGHGQSDCPETGYSLADQAADIAGLVRALDLEKPALIGHSMGASSVAVLAATYPELPSRIVLEDPAWREPAEGEADDRPRRQEWKKSAMERKAKSLDEIATEGRNESPSWDAIEFEPWAEAKKQLSPNVFTWTAGADLSGWQETAKSISCPTLLVTAEPELGSIVTDTIATEARALCPSIEVAHLAGAGHNIRRERFGEFVDAVKAFLAPLQG